MVSYDQLANCLLSTDINLRWLSQSTPKAVVNTTRWERNRAGQFVPTALALKADPSPLALERTYDRTSTSPSSSLKPTVPAVRRSTTPAFNPDHTNDTCFNCGQLGHRSPDCPALCAPRTQIKELQETLDSDSEDDQLADGPGKDIL